MSAINIFLCGRGHSMRYSYIRSMVCLQCKTSHIEVAIFRSTFSMLLIGFAISSYVHIDLLSVNCAENDTTRSHAQTFTKMLE